MTSGATGTGSIAAASIPIAETRTSGGAKQLSSTSDLSISGILSMLASSAPAEFRRPMAPGGTPSTKDSLERLSWPRPPATERQLMMRRSGWMLSHPADQKGGEDGLR